MEQASSIGAVVHAFTTGAIVQVFLLACNIPSGRLEQGWAKQ
jgi:hypothetical protein